MDLVNPFEQVVVFGKAYSTQSVLHGTNVVTLRSLVPTGKHVGTGNNLVHASGPKKGGPATKLEHYRKGKVGKAAGSTVGRAIVRSRGMAPPTVAPRAAAALKKVKPISFTDVGTVGRRQTG